MLSEGEKCRQLLPSSPMSSTFLMRSGIGLPTVESSSPQARIWLQKSRLLLLLLGAQHRVGGLAQSGFCLRGLFKVFPPNLCLLPIVFFQCWSKTAAGGFLGFFSWEERLQGFCTSSPPDIPLVTSDLRYCCGASNAKLDEPWSNLG